MPLPLFAKRDSAQGASGLEEPSLQRAPSSAPSPKKSTIGLPKLPKTTRDPLSAMNPLSAMKAKKKAETTKAEKRRYSAIPDPMERQVLAASKIQAFTKGMLHRRRVVTPALSKSMSSNAAAVKKIEPLERTLAVRLVEVNRLSDIDIIGQRFRAEVVVQLVFEGGALDEHLSSKDDGFPLDAAGRPTFRPSAGWYMAQVDFNNAHEYTMLDKTCTTEGDDIVMNLRFEGTFSEVMELENFPFDCQDLTMSMAFNCRTTGMMPLKLVNSSRLSTGILPDGFVDGKMWSLHPELDVIPGASGRSADRMFPCIDMRFLVGRVPNFYMINIALPVFFFVPMAMLQFTVERNLTDARLSVSLAIVLTAVAHKFSMTTLVPPISYMTFLDIYVIASLLLIVIITFQGGINGIVEIYFCRLQASFADSASSSTDAETATATYDSASGVSDDPSSGQDLLGNSGGRRELVVAGGSAGGSAGAKILRYVDMDCPPEKYGPMNIFDAFDLGSFAIDFVAWILLNGWVVWKYKELSKDFKRRVDIITTRRKEARKRELAEGYKRDMARKTLMRSSSNLDGGAGGEGGDQAPELAGPSRKYAAFGFGSKSNGVGGGGGGIVGVARAKSMGNLWAAKHGAQGKAPRREQLPPLRRAASSNKVAPLPSTMVAPLPQRPP